MTPYWLLFLFPVIGALFPVRATRHVREIAFVSFAFLATVMMGLRHQVGADWVVYLDYLNAADSLITALALPDPGYMVINWLSAELGLGIAGVNLIGSGLFIYGLLDFCKRQPFPWLGLAVAVPYVVIVIGMGYSRQAIALGFIFMSLSCWQKSEFLKYLIWIFFAAIFHKTAIAMVFLGFFMKSRRLAIKWLFIVLTLILLFIFSLQQQFFEAQFVSYIVQVNYESQGALVRVIMNVVPALVCLLFYKKFSLFGDHRLLVTMSGLSIVSIPFVFQYSTVVDRLLVYLTPIQILVYSRLPLFANNALQRQFLMVIIVIIYGLALWVWINFAVNSEFWLPYDWVLFQ